MKKMILSGICMVAGLLLTGGENLVRNGGFEDVVKKAKSTDKYMMNQIKNGWDFGPGPLAVLPADWLPNGGKCKLEIIMVGENGENKENVHGGKNAAHFSGEGAHIATSASVKPGKYELSFWYKGSGVIQFCFYCYGINPTTGKPGVHLKTLAVINLRADTQEWTQFKEVVQAGDGSAEIVQCSLALAVSKCDLYIDDVSLTTVEEKK